MTKQKSKLIFFIAAILWGSSYAIQKPVLDVIDPVSFTFWNFFLSGCIFLLYAIWKKIPLLYRWREGVILGVFLSGIEIFEMVGLKLTSSANTVFLTNIGMLMIPFVSYLFFRKSVKTVDSVAILIASIGMYFLVGGVRGFGLGDGIVLFSSLASALYFIYSERFEGEKASYITTLCVQQFFIISIICLIWGRFANLSFAVDASYHFTILWQTLLFTTIPYAVIQWASEYADEMIAAIYDGVVEPLTGGILSWVIFHEATTPIKVMGGGLMIFAFIFSALISKRHFIYNTIVRTFLSKE
jgi:drug/metabolite transporter (DMT)-like permease